MIVVEERCVGGSRLACHCGLGAAVHEVNVEPAVVVVVQQSHAGADGFKDVSLFWRTHLVMPGRKASFGGDVFEDEWARFYAAACGDGTMCGIEDRGENTGGSGSSMSWWLGPFLGVVFLGFERILGVQSRDYRQRKTDGYRKSSRQSDC